jgi:uncharacterized protein with PIN domain
MDDGDEFYLREGGYVHGCTAVYWHGSHNMEVREVKKL